MLGGQHELSLGGRRQPVARGFTRAVDAVAQTTTRVAARTC